MALLPGSPHLAPASSAAPTATNCAPWVEAVPNFSEGRDSEVIKALSRALDGHGARVLHVDPNADAHRTVITLAGPLDSVVAALFDGISVALERIDMRRHEGAHIRIGAADVVPLVVLEPGPGAVEKCKAATLGLAHRLSAEHDLPLFLYEHSALRTPFASLPRCRRGGYEALEERFQQGASGGTDGPDLGPCEWNEAVARTGATVLGVRNLLVAMNFTLDSRDVELAQSIACAIRTAGPEDRPHRIPALRAVGWLMPGYGGRAQVSTNLLDPRQTSAHAVLELLRSISPVEILGAELIGLCPARVLRDAALSHRGESTPLWSADEVLDWGAAREGELLEEGWGLLGLGHLGAAHPAALPSERILERALQAAGWSG